MDVVGEGSGPPGGGTDAGDEEVEERRADDAALRHAHFYLHPRRRGPLVETPNPPVAQIRDEPAFEV